MKIGILTVPFNNNYGGFLQAYALKKVLLDMGHNVIFINRKRNRPRGLKNRIKRFLISLNMMKDESASKTEDISINTNQFKTKYLEPITEEYYTTRRLKRCMKLEIDCFIVGSDQVWRYRYAKDSIDDFFFNFLSGTGIPRFSYAASMGTSYMEYPDNKLQKCADLLKEFRCVSVRETSALKLLSEDFGYRDAKLVLDPTMLLGSEAYCELMDKEMISVESPYLFTYILDDSEDKNTIIDVVANARNMKRVNMKAQTGELSSMNIIEPVEKWLSSIYYSDFVITDSFHGVVFSIIFHVPFIVFANIQRGADRIMSLLTMFGLGNRLYDEDVDIQDYFSNDINWNLVDERLYNQRLLSMDFLKNALNDKEIK